MIAPDRVAFTVFGLEIMWYGILIAAAMALAIIIMCKRAPQYNMTSNDVINFILVAVPMGVIGARLYFVLFNWDNYSDNLLGIFAFRGGGLAIHGGIIFGVLGVLIAAAIWKIRPMQFMDLAAPSLALAQSIGRWGNFFNQEAYGSPTDLPWALNINGEMVHPTFLYESIWTFLVFIILMVVARNQKFAGQIFYLYCILYSFERFFVEGLRTDSLMVGSFKVAQIVSLIAFVLFLLIYLYARRKEKKSHHMFSRY